VTIDDSTHKALLAEKTRLAVESAFRAETNPFTIRAQLAPLILAVSSAFDIVLASLFDEVPADYSFIGDYLGEGLPPEPLLQALSVLAGLMWEGLRHLGTRRGTEALATDFFSRFHQLDTAVRAEADHTSDSRAGLAAQTAVATDLLRGRAAVQHPSTRSDRHTAYLVLVMHRESVSVENLRRAVLHTFETSDDLGILPALDADDPVLLAPAEAAFPHPNYRSGSETILNALDLKEPPVAGLALANDASRIPDAAHEARFVAQSAHGLRKPRGTYTVEDLWQELVTRQVPDLADILTKRLGMLEADDGYLLDTLRVYLSGGRYRAQTAAELHIHPNTLDYRLRKIHQLTGLNPQLPRGAATLDVALTAWTLATHPRPTTPDR